MLLDTGTTFNGAKIIALPSDLAPPAPRIRGPRSIEFDRIEVVAKNTSPFTGQTQTYDWMQSWWEAQVSIPPLDRLSYDYWSAFIGACRGNLNAFMLGDPKARLPKGSARGTPLVNGASQTGYSVSTRGWAASAKSVLLPNDYIQIGYRLFSVCDVVDADSSGDANIPIWPPLRETPSDGDAVTTHNCRGLFKLKNNSGNKTSVNVGAYGAAGFAVVEAI